MVTSRIAAVRIGRRFTACWPPGAAAYGQPLINDLTQAKPLWRSEAVTLAGWGNGADARYKDRAALGTLCGGASTPGRGGRRHLSLHVPPSGDVVPVGAEAALVDKFRGHPLEHDSMRRWFSKRADVVVTAIDGATGQTVWQSVWPLKQGNFQTHKWRGINPTPPSPTEFSWWPTTAMGCTPTTRRRAR